MYDPIAITKALSVDCAFDPRFDLRAVDQVGFLDIRKSFDSGTIDGDVNIRDEHFNGVLDPDDMLNRPLDQFEAMRQLEYVRTTLKAAESKTEPSTSEGDTK